MRLCLCNQAMQESMKCPDTFNHSRSLAWNREDSQKKKSRKSKPFIIVYDLLTLLKLLLWIFKKKINRTLNWARITYMEICLAHEASLEIKTSDILETKHIFEKHKEAHMPDIIPTSKLNEPERKWASQSKNRTLFITCKDLIALDSLVQILYVTFLSINHRLDWGSTANM